MSKRLGLAVLAAVIAVAAFAGMTLATPGVGVTSTTIAAGDLAPVDLTTRTGDWKLALRTKGNSDVSVVENRVTPGGTFGWHNHLGPSIVVVKAGALTFYRAEDPTCTGEVYSAGQALLAPGNTDPCRPERGNGGRRGHHDPDHPGRCRDAHRPALPGNCAF